MPLRSGSLIAGPEQKDNAHLGRPPEVILDPDALPPRDVLDVSEAGPPPAS